MAAGHGGGRPSWSRASTANDLRSHLHEERSKRCTFLGLLQEVVWHTWTVLPALFCTQPLPTYVHECQREELNPPWAACSRAGRTPTSVRHCAVSGSRSPGRFHGDWHRKGGRTAGAAGSLCTGQSGRHHASVPQEPARKQRMGISSPSKAGGTGCFITVEQHLSWSCVCCNAGNTSTLFTFVWFCWNVIAFPLFFPPADATITTNVYYLHYCCNPSTSPPLVA